VVKTYPISDLDIFSQESLNRVRRESTEPVKAFTSHRHLEGAAFLASENFTKKIETTHGRAGRP
jgi:hypothetical protein